MVDPFDKNFSPEPGRAVEVAPGIRRIVAPNASPMTFTGTNSYLLGESEIAVIDPGPKSEAHLQALLNAIGGANVSHILVTHSHVDHSPLAAELSRQTDAPVLALGASNVGISSRMKALGAGLALGGGEGTDHDFAPDHVLRDREILRAKEWQIEAITTPGHFGNHMCFASDGRVFSGDHVMGWATTMVSPPDGDLTDFMASLAKMAARTDDQIYLPGHGKPVTDPHGMIAHQIAHRNQREAQILEALQVGASTPDALAARIYTEIPAALLPAAARNVLAHLIDLEHKNKVAALGPLGAKAKFQRLA